jgi:ribosomal protein S2
MRTSNKFRYSDFNYSTIKNKLVLKNKLMGLGLHLGHSRVVNLKIPNTWVLGLRRGYFVFNLDFTIFYLQKALFFLKETNFFFSTTLFYYSKLQSDSAFELTTRAFLKNSFLDVPGCSFIYLKWSPGLISNYKICFLDFIDFVTKQITVSGYSLKQPMNFRVRYISKITSANYFIILFFKVFYILEERININNTVDILSEYKKLAHLLRIFVFLRFWKSFFWIPDTLCMVNTNAVSSPVHEFNTLKLPVVSTVDSNNNLYGISYPVPMNDDSMITIVFITILFLNVIRTARSKF